MSIDMLMDSVNGMEFEPAKHPDVLELIPPYVIQRCDHHAYEGSRGCKRDAEFRIVWKEQSMLSCWWHTEAVSNKLEYGGSS